MTTNRNVIVDLHISQDDYLLWYQGAVNSVYARTLDGRSVSFPANILQPFVTHSGVHGRFLISFDDRNKFKSIQRHS